MEILTNRVASFAPRPKRRGVAASAGWPLSSSSHPHLTPDALAAAGWFFTPSKDNPDLVTCFLCKKELGGWDEGDDPFTEHVGHAGEECGWAITRCKLEIAKRNGGQASGEIYK